MKYNNENTRLQSEKSTKIETSVAELLKETKEIKKHLIQYNFHMKMDTVDLSEYFPLKTDAQLKKFMQHDDEWNLRKKECFNYHTFRLFLIITIIPQAFNQLLFNAVTKKTTTFATALLHVLFSRDFIRDHKWPGSGG